MTSRQTPMLSPDYAKCLGIALVVFGHVLRGLQTSGLLVYGPVWAAVDRTIYLFHMPLFFYLSGLFFGATVEHRGYAGMLRRHAITLLAPLVVWSYAQFSLQYFFSDAANAQLSLFDVLTAPFPPKQQFWFLGTLFAVSAVVGLMSRWSKAALCAAIAALFLGRFVFADTMQIMFKSPFTISLGEFIIYAPYFILGIVADTHVLGRLKVGTPFLLVAVVVSLIVAETAPFAGSLWDEAAACICAMAIYKICLNIEGQTKDSQESAVARWLAFIGMNSMIIYLAHVIAAAAFRTLLNHVGVHAVAPHLIGGWLAGIAGPLALVPLGLWLQKHYPAFAAAFVPVRGSRQKKVQAA